MPSPILPLVVKARGAAASAASGGQAAEPSGCVGGHFKTILNRDWVVFEFCAAAVCGTPFFFLGKNDVPHCHAINSKNATFDM
jgi:hypothetical protein